MEDFKQISISYDKSGAINFDYDMSDPQEAVGVLANVMNAVIHRMAGEDKELLYLTILETMQFLRKPIEVKYPNEESEEIVEADKTEEVA